MGVPIKRHRLKASPEMAFSMGFSQLFSLPMASPEGFCLMTFQRLLSLPVVFTTGFEISSSTNLTERADLKFVYSSFPSFNAFPTNIYHDQKLQRLRLKPSAEMATTTSWSASASPEGSA